jgi:peptide-methionine (S)-S-oxide reductase
MRKSSLIWTAIVTVLVVAGVRNNGGAREIQFPDPAVDAQLSAKPTEESIVVAGGCFWGVQAVFQHVKGVVSATSGYSGGTVKNPSYEAVCTGRTGHAESVQVVYDPSKVTLGQILKTFFSVAHDPTEMNRQGPDTGAQYRSAVFYADEGQQRITRAYIEQLNQAKIFRRPIATQVVALEQFYQAEAYHQDYAAKHPYEPYIAINDLPKVDALRKQLPDLYRK